MAKQFPNSKGFLVIEAPAHEFLKIGMGYNGNVYCDNTGTLINPNETCYYVAVLNNILSKAAYEEWNKKSVYYDEDAQIEEKRAKNMFKWFHIASLWEDEISNK